MNGKQMSGEITGREMSGRKMTDANITSDSEQAPVPPARATQVERVGSVKKKSPIGWLFPVAALGFFLGHFWSYVPVVRGIVSLFVVSKILTGSAPGAFLL
ncbi:MAG TPA: hypothetical protein VI431_15220 [Candidatus Acidoferrum sp.]